MDIEVSLFAGMGKYSPDGKEAKHFCLDVAAGTTVESVLKKLDIPESAPKILIVNGMVTHSKAMLKQGDILSIYPPVGGG